MRAVRRKRTTLVLGFTTGLLLGLLLFGRRGCFESAREALRDLPPREDPLRLVSLPPGPPPRRLLLFAGVMTAAKYLPTRAAAVHGTWGKKVPGRMAFFSGRDSRRPDNAPDLPLVAIPTVDDSYPPQKKSFLMLDYMYTNYIDHFEWFLRADDDVYIRMDKLESFLRSVDSRKPFFIGQAGRGNQEEFGRLSLEYDENFCMGGPGVILSRETLSRVAPHVRACLGNLYTTHEDVELGRCVQKFAGVSCTWSYEMQTIFYHNSSGKDAFTGNLKQKEVHRAITLHPVKDHSNMFRIHNYMQMLRIQELQEESVNLHRDMFSMSKLLNMTSLEASPHISPYSREYLGDTTLLGQKPGLNKYRGTSIDDLIPWDFIQRAVYSDTHSNPRRKIESALKEGLDDIVREAMEKINMYSKQRGRIIDFKDILYGYHRYNPLYGADYILDMLLIYRKYRGKKMTVPVRRHTYFQQQFTGLEIREVFEGEEVGGGREEIEEEEDTNDNGSFKEAFETGLMKISGNLPSILLPSAEQHNSPDKIIKDKVVNFIVPLSGRFETFQRFVKIFEDVCLSNYEKVTLRVVLFPNDESNIKSSLDVVRQLQEKYQYTSITVVPVFEEFSRAKALDIGATHVKEPNDLLFFIDVDMVFDRGILHRIRTNTIRGKQVYFPIVYSEYDPRVIFNLSISPNHFLINEETGFWRQFGFGIASVYKTDLIKVGGYNTTIKGWGKEDVDLFDRFIKNADKISIFRSADPELVHVFHTVECDPKLDDIQKKMCLGTRADTYAGIKTLSDILYRNEKAFKFAQSIR